MNISNQQQPKSNIDNMLYANSCLYGDIKKMTNETNHKEIERIARETTDINKNDRLYINEIEKQNNKQIENNETKLNKEIVLTETTTTDKKEVEKLTNEIKALTKRKNALIKREKINYNSNQVKEIVLGNSGLNVDYCETEINKTEDTTNKKRILASMLIKAFKLTKQ